MSLEENKEIIRKFKTEGFNEHNLDPLDRLIAPDYVNHHVQLRGLKANKQVFAVNLNDSHNWYETIEDIAVKGTTWRLARACLSRNRGQMF